MTTARDSEADERKSSAHARRAPKRRPQWIVWIRVRPTEEERAWEADWVEECERRAAHPERDEHGRTSIPHEEVMAKFERRLRVQVESTRKERRTWRRRVSRARHTRHIARLVARGSFGVPCIEVVPADEGAPRVIQPSWHRRAGLGAEPRGGPFIVIGHHDDAPVIDDPRALQDEIQRALEDAWDAGLPWEQVEPPLREKYAHVWLGSHAGDSPPAYEDVYAAFEKKTTGA